MIFWGEIGRRSTQIFRICEVERVETALILLGQAAILATFIRAGLAVAAHIHNKQIGKAIPKSPKLIKWWLLVSGEK